MEEMDNPISLELSTEEENLLKRLRETDQMRGISPKVIQLRQTLALKAKKDPKFRFYSLFGHIYRKDVLESSWKLVSNNNGSPGVDNVSIKYIRETEGKLEELLREIEEEVKNRKYKPKPIKRAYIP